MRIKHIITVPCPDLEIKGEGKKIFKKYSKNIFSALQASVWAKDGGGGGRGLGTPGAPPLDPPLHHLRSIFLIS